MQRVSIEYYSINKVALDVSLSTLEAASLCVCVGLPPPLLGGVEEPVSEPSQSDSRLCLKRSAAVVKAASMPVQHLALAYPCSVVLPKVCVCIGG